MPLPIGGYGRRGPMAAPNREHDSSRSDLGGLLIGDAFSMGRTGRMALPVARRHGDPPAPPCGSGDNHPDGNKRTDDSAGPESPSRVEGRSRRRGDHGVPLSGGSLGDLDVLHDDRSTRRRHREVRADLPGQLLERYPHRRRLVLGSLAATGAVVRSIPAFLLGRWADRDDRLEPHRFSAALGMSTGTGPAVLIGVAPPARPARHLGSRQRVGRREREQATASGTIPLRIASCLR